MDSSLFVLFIFYLILHSLFFYILFDSSLFTLPSSLSISLFPFYIPLALKIFSLASLISLNLRSAARLTSSPRVATRSG